jgi:hypothetical protein
MTYNHILPLETVKNYLRLDSSFTADDQDIERMVRSAFGIIEKQTGCVLQRQNVTYKRAYCGFIDIYEYPVIYNGNLTRLDYAARWDLNVAAAQFFANPQVAPEDQNVLGAQKDEAVAIPVSDQAVKGVSDDKSNNEFSPLGIAWYWWLVVAAGIAGLWWLIATLRRGAKEENL